MFVLEVLLNRILEEQLLDWHGIHGLSHWGRVHENGLRLLEESGARRDVVELFAFFHDSQRLNDGHDPDHGLRGAELARRLRGEVYEIDDAGFRLLHVACRDHTRGRSHPDVTVATCWDSDRLDLGRVGITPDPLYLGTDAARSDHVIEWALHRSREESVPEAIAPIWQRLWSDLPGDDGRSRSRRTTAALRKLGRRRR